MTKRIIDGMSSQEIVDGIFSIGIFSINYGYKIVKIGDYIHQICKPEPTWEDDVSDAGSVILDMKLNELELLADDKKAPKKYNAC